jgi:hypothetical protein
MSEHLEHSTAAAGHGDVGYDHAEPSGRPLFLLTAIAAITVVILISGVTAFFNHVEEDAVHDKILVPEADNLVSLHQREDKQLYSYQFIDRAKGTVQLPIDRAMELVIKESGEGKLPFPQKTMPVVADVVGPAGSPAAVPPSAAPANAVPTNAAPKK